MLNRAIIMGRLTDNPELRHTASNIPVTTFTLAVERNFNSGDERVTDFQPMNANFGLMPQLGYKVKGGKKGRNDEFARRALESAEKLVIDGILPAVSPICRAIPTNESDSQNGETEA